MWLFLISFLSSAFLFSSPPPPINIEDQAQGAINYFLKELEHDLLLTNVEQHEKVQKFKAYADQLSPEVASLVTQLLLKECRAQVVELFQQAALDELEIKSALADYDKALLSFRKMDVETARQMLFFIEELKLHRQYVYEFGMVLGCPERQLLRHDLCKLSSKQFEGYVRYFRGGRQEEDKLAYLDAWEAHQCEEHHHECYSKTGFDFDSFPQERLRDNMLEAVADLLAATKQRGGSTLTEWLLNQFPKKDPHPRLIPYLEEALIKAHAFYLESEKNPIFKGLPCWNNQIAELFSKLKVAS